MTRKVVLRADADATIGLGHAMRAFAIAQALHDEGAVVELVSVSCSPEIAARFDDEGVPVRRIEPGPAEAEQATAGLERGDWIVLDGYHFDAAYVARCEARGVRALVVDDDAARAPIVASALLNPNLHASREPYASWACGTWLLGTRWTPMRREFREHAGPVDRTPRLLLTMGGSDPPGATGKLLPTLAEGLADLRIDVVIGSASARAPEVRALAARFRHVNVLADVRNMSTVMRGASVAVSASGSTAWELAACGVPMVLASLAANQRPVATALAASGAALDLGPHDAIDPEQVLVAVRAILDDASRSRALVDRARGVVDGRGALRIARFLRTGEAGDPDHGEIE